MHVREHRAVRQNDLLALAALGKHETGAAISVTQGFAAVVQQQQHAPGVAQAGRGLRIDAGDADDGGHAVGAPVNVAGQLADAPFHALMVSGDSAQTLKRSLLVQAMFRPGRTTSAMTGT